MLIYLGRFTAFTRNLPISVISIDGIPRLTLERNDRNQVSVTTDIFDETGRIIAEIVKNEFTVNPNNYFKIIRSDKSSLVVVSQKKEEVLTIRYLNASAVKIKGIFRYPRLPEPILVTDDGANIPGIASFGFVCMGNPRAGGSIIALQENKATE